MFFFNLVLNKSSGGSSKLSVLSYAGFLATIVLFLSKLIAFIPIPALAGLMIVVASKTFEWKESYHIILNAKKSTQSLCDAVAMLITMILCAKADMSIGVIVGAIISFLPDITKKFLGISMKKV
jgi:SulP family sulfate permease